MNYYLIDYENIKNDGVKSLSSLKGGDTIFLFYSDQCKSISLDVIDRISSQDVDLRCYKVKTGTKNALDFQLSSYLGYLIGKGNKGDRYHIVSDDKGYDCLCDYWMGQNVSLDRITVSAQPAAKEPSAAKKTAAPKKTAAAPSKKKSKVSAKDQATLEEIKAYLSEDDAPDQVLVIFNQYKTKMAINNGLAKKFKDSKRASNIYKKLKPLLKEKNKS